MRNTINCVIASSFLVFSSTAGAGIVAPPLAIEFQVNGKTVWSDDPAGMFEPDGTFSYGGGASGANWSLEYQANTRGGAETRGDRLSWVDLSGDIKNEDDITLHFTLMGTMPIDPAIIPAIMGGSAQGGLTAGPVAPATLAALPGGSIYIGLIDSVPAPGSELFVDPMPNSSVTVSDAFNSGSLGAASFGAPIPSDPAPNVLSEIGVRFDFTLDPGATATLSGIFVLNIPTPGALAIFGLAGFIAFRRRRV